MGPRKRDVEVSVAILCLPSTYNVYIEIYNDRQITDGNRMTTYTIWTTTIWSENVDRRGRHCWQFNGRTIELFVSFLYA